MRLRSAETLRALMRQQGLSLSGLATAAQCSKSFISHLLSGRRNTCTNALAERIAEALDVPTRVIFVPSKSITDRQSDYRSPPPPVPEPASEVGSAASDSSPAAGPTRPEAAHRKSGSRRFLGSTAIDNPATPRQARLTSRCGWVPQRVLWGNRGKAVGRLAGPPHRRPATARAGRAHGRAQAATHRTEVTSACSSEAAKR
jgi:transcriptional regulator with XRE-family HTH domain